MSEIEKSRLILKVMKNFKKSMSERFEKHFSDMNITGPQGMLVGILVHQGEMKISDLSKKMYLSNSTVSGIIDRLEKNDVVERRRSKEDRRIVMVDLTDEFRKKAKERFKSLENHFTGIIKLATPEELDKILEGFKTLDELMCRAMNDMNSEE